MTPESILANKALILTQQARESYFEQGYFVANGFLTADWSEGYTSIFEHHRRDQ